MEGLYITKDQFWDWFNRSEDSSQSTEGDYKVCSRRRLPRTLSDAENDQNNISYSDNRNLGNKRMKKDSTVRSISELETATSSERYIIMFGPHKPGKKTKVWESDGYLTMVSGVAHVSDLRGRILEEPTLLDDIDQKCVEELGELTIGNTEVQVIELDKK